jgi:hypothetical protein
MRRLGYLGLLLCIFCACAFLGACSRSSASDSLKPGASVTVTMKDGTIVAGRLVEANDDHVVVDPLEGGEWKTLARAQVASVTQPDAATAAAAPAEAPGTSQATDAQPGSGTRSATSGAARSAERRTPDGAMASAPAPEPNPEFREITVPASTVLHLRLQSRVASDTSHVEDPVRASLTSPVRVEGVEVVPADSEMKGVVTAAQPSGKVKGRAAVAFRFDTLVADGQQYRVQTQAIAREAKGTKKKDAMKIGIPAAGGAVIGGLLGGGKGAIIGAAAGGGAGTAVVLATPGEELRLPAGTALSVKLLEPLAVRVLVNRR